MTEKEFLDLYNPNKYEKPSVTVDILIFTVNKGQKIELLLIKRGGHPFLGKWALPGGFVGIRESLDEAAKRELLEETGVCSDYHLEQLYTFGTVNRDPRMRVISVAYVALAPKADIKPKAGDDAADAEFFQIVLNDRELEFITETGRRISVKDLAFDHEEIIRTGFRRLVGKLEYTDLAFQLLENRQCFTIGELKGIYECIKGQPLDSGNFHRMFKAKYLNEDIVEELPQTSTKYSKKPSRCYRYKR